MEYLKKKRRIIKPELFIIGAAKSGSTTLHHHIAAHPQIFMSEPKELFYFNEEMNWSKGEEWYLSHFLSASPGQIVGESSVTYSMRPKLSDVPQRILQFNPDARFVYIMRDPVEQTISHYLHRVRGHGEQRDIIEAIRQEPFYCDVSHYAMQLEPYFKLFGQDKVFVLTLEEMKKNLAKTLSKLYMWLGVDSSFEPCEKKLRKNVTPIQVEMQKGAGILNRMRYSTLWNLIAPIIPQGYIQYGKKMAVTTFAKESVKTKEVVVLLRDRHLKQAQRLSILLNRDFPDWKTLYNK